MIQKGQQKFPPTVQHPFLYFNLFEKNQPKNTEPQLASDEACGGSR